MDVKGLAAVVTGGGSGLGEATGRRLREAGAKVTLLDINQEAAEAAAARMGALACHCDVTDEHSVAAALETASAAHGVARIIINCAGVGPARRILGREAPHDLQFFIQVVQINLVGSFNVMRLATEAISKLDPLDAVGERGIVINTASVAAFDGQIGQAAYAASKGGVAAMTLPAARELARFGIRVLTIAPGIFGTPMLYALPQDIQDSLGASVPFPSRLGNPSEFADLALHMCQNQMLNGEVIRLDGALRMAPK